MPSLVIMHHQRWFLVSIFLCFAIIEAYAQPTFPRDPGRFSDSLTGRAGVFLKSHPTERIFIVFDRDFYAMGDQCHFMALVLDGTSAKMSMTSGVLYVDWIHPSGKISKRQRLSIINGRASGSIIFMDPFLPGTYTVRAYTNIMRNVGPGSFFYKQIPLNITIPGVHETRTVDRTVDSPGEDLIDNIQFFPEGGTLLSGVKSLMAFKAVGESGRGVDFAGTLVDDQGKVINAIRSSHGGMGAFPVMINAGSSLRLQLADGRLYSLPAAQERGITIAATNISTRFVNVVLRSNQVKDQLVYLIGRVRGVVCYSAHVNIKAAEHKLTIPKHGLPVGILQLNLLDASGNSLSERSIFLHPPPNDDLRVSVSRSLQSLDSLVVNISGRDPFDSTDAIAMRVTTGALHDDAIRTRIDNEFYLRSRLNGYLADTEQYFGNSSRTSRYALDLVMLTHEVNEPSWHDILSNRPWNFSTETGISLKGKILVGNKPARSTTFAVSTFAETPSLNIFVTDSIGQFRIDNLNFSDTISTYWKVMAKNGKSYTTNVSIRIDSLLDPPPVVKAYLSSHNQSIVDDFRKRHPTGYDTLQKLTGGAKVLQGVEIKASRLNIRHFRGNYVVAPDERDVKHKVSTASFVARYLIGLNFAEMIVDKDGDMAWGVPYLGRVVPIGPVFIDGVEYETKGAGGNPLYILQAIPIEEVDRVVATRTSFALWTKRSRFQDGAIRIKLKGFDSSIDNIVNTFTFDSTPGITQTILWKEDLQFDFNGISTNQIYFPLRTGTVHVLLQGVINNRTIDQDVTFSP